ncbi:signal recognition particle 9 kDa protein-domain-containing protein [Amylocarpus encephaloides]|uniref:Signal recognition particle 9 kDa protein-domain-containing protein n=1 Tax=Amylocarpus encephaloides TaxID=45428 RepID=A0A9P8C2D5_9HELO|nr:signal recognition particle 9 kDa protein-domain-containing protein [Amylocarpus encephaloides]
MPTLATAPEWLTQSSLLLQARPSTTRITTKYSFPRRPNPLSKSKSKSTPPEPSATPSSKPPPAATLTLKTYDPTSGATLKYQTNKAAEVGRLIQILGRLARPMAGLPGLKEEDIAMLEAPTGGEAGGSGIATPIVEAEKPLGGGAAKGNAPAGGASGKKGKKKGKK